jgi:hypothetical protein
VQNVVLNIIWRIKMPVKFGKSSVQVDRETKKKTVMHEYMKTKTIDELVETFNKEGVRPKLRQKVKNEIVRRNKLGLTNIVFTDRSIQNELLG